VTVFEQARDAEAAVDAVDRGGVSGVVLDDVVPVDRIVTLVRLLAKGSPVPVATRLALGSETDVRPRFAGDPGVAVATGRGTSAHLSSIIPTEPDSFRIVYRSFLSTKVLVGSEDWVVTDFLDSRKFLAGAPERDLGETDVSGVLRLHDEPDSILRFSDRLVFPDDSLTAEAVETFARRALSEEPTRAEDLKSR
jgi:hypothetical protein